MSRQLTPGAPLPVLVTAYARAGWLGLDGADVRAARGTLEALARLLDPRSGQGFTTVNQIADAACYSPRRVRTMLTEVLEPSGLVSWTRGGIVSGRPQPSIIRVSKTLLLALIRSARPALARIREIRAERTRNRIAGLRRLTVKPRNARRPNGLVHAATAATPSPLRGRVQPRPSPKEIDTMRDERRKYYCDSPVCVRSTYRPEFNGWMLLSGKHWCPEHDPGRNHDPYPDPDPDEMTDAQLALYNRARANGGLPPLIRTLV